MRVFSLSYFNNQNPGLLTAQAQVRAEICSKCNKRLKEGSYFGNNRISHASVLVYVHYVQVQAPTVDFDDHVALCRSLSE